MNNNDNNNRFLTDIQPNNNQMNNNNMHIKNLNQQINNNINFNNMINFNNNNNMNNNMNINININQTGFQNDNMAGNFKVYYSPEINNGNNNDSNMNDVQNNEVNYELNEDDLTKKIVSKIYKNNSQPLKETNILQKGNFSDDEINKIKKICVSYFDFSKPNDQKNADKISQMIKQNYENTEWFVLCCEKSSGNNEDFDFKFTYFENENTLILHEKKVLFYICKL